MVKISYIIHHLVLTESTPNEADAPLKERILAGGPSNVGEIGEEAPLGVAPAPMLSTGLANTELSRKGLVDQVLLSTYVSPQERIHPQTGIVSPDPGDAWEIIHRWSPFNQVESPVAHMRDLYPNYFRVPVVALAEKHTIPFPIYMDKEAFQLVAEDGMLICNHDFHRSTKLICADF